MKSIMILGLIFTLNATAQTHTGGTDIGERATTQFCKEATSKILSSYSSSCKSKKNIDQIISELMILKSLSSEKECKDGGEKKAIHCSITPSTYLGIQKIYKHYKEMKLTSMCSLTHSEKDLEELLEFMKTKLESKAQ